MTTTAAVRATRPKIQRRVASMRVSVTLEAPGHEGRGTQRRLDPSFEGTAARVNTSATIHDVQVGGALCPLTPPDSDEPAAACARRSRYSRTCFCDAAFTAKDPEDCTTFDVDMTGDGVGPYSVRAEHL